MKDEHGNTHFRPMRVIDGKAGRMKYPTGRYCVALVHPSSGERVMWVGYESHVKKEDAQREANMWEDAYHTARRIDEEKEVG